MNYNKFLKNLSFALLAQIISLLSSFFVQFFAPKVLSVEEYAYWQLFLFYVSYINISRIGIIDGIYLKLGGKSRNEINESLMKTKWLIFLFLQVAVATIMIFISNYYVVDNDRKFVLIACAVCMILINSNNFFGFLFQAINETNIYSISEIIYNSLWFIAVGILCVYKIENYRIIVYMYILGQVIAFCYLIYKAKFILVSDVKKLKETIIDMIDDAKCGISLLISMYASMLVIGTARLVVDNHWGIEAFGYFSFSISLTTFLLKFISQISMVLFPTIRKIKDDSQKQIFNICNTILAVILPSTLLLFVPMKILIEKWLPQYESSLYYLGILLPICVLDGKMQLLYSTYLKVFRKEKILLVINIIAVFISFGLSSIGAYIFNNLELIAWGLLTAIAVRSILAEIILVKFMNIDNGWIGRMTEILMIIGFAFLSMHWGNIQIFLMYLIMYSCYLLLNYQTIKILLPKIKIFLDRRR